MPQHFIELLEPFVRMDWVFHFQFPFKLPLCTRDAVFYLKLITVTAPHHQIANNHRQLPTHYGSLPANYRHLYDIQYKGCLPLPVIYRQGWSIYHRLPPLMKNYRHVGNVYNNMKICCSKKT